MKLATFDPGDGERIGIRIDGGLIDLSRVGHELPKDMIALMTAWPRLGDDIAEIGRTQKPHFTMEAVRLLAPVPRPQKILAIGLNYADHIEESGMEMPKRQIWFSKLPNAVNGPNDPIQIPRAAPDSVDYEAEFVVIIGTRCRHVSREEAAGVIFGYCAGNDVSVREWQFHTQQWILGKSFDTHAPFGPVIVTADEIGDPHNLGICCFVNGEMRQNSNTRHLVFDVFDQVALLSQAMTLEPGDVIFTGTPGGVGMAHKPPAYLKAGDIVRVEIDKIGALEAELVAEPDAA